LERLSGNLWIPRQNHKTYQKHGEIRDGSTDLRLCGAALASVSAAWAPAR
jgi:hypothetical protein